MRHVCLLVLMLGLPALSDPVPLNTPEGAREPSSARSALTTRQRASSPHFPTFLEVAPDSFLSSFWNSVFGRNDVLLPAMTGSPSGEVGGISWGDMASWGLEESRGINDTDCSLSVDLSGFGKDVKAEAGYVDDMLELSFFDKHQLGGRINWEGVSDAADMAAASPNGLRGRAVGQSVNQATFSYQVPARCGDVVEDTVVHLDVDSRRMRVQLPFRSRHDENVEARKEHTFRRIPISVDQ